MEPHSTLLLTPIVGICPLLHDLSGQWPLDSCAAELSGEARSLEVFGGHLGEGKCTDPRALPQHFPCPNPSGLRGACFGVEAHCQAILLVSGQGRDHVMCRGLSTGCPSPALKAARGGFPGCGPRGTPGAHDKQGSHLV